MNNSHQPLFWLRQVRHESIAPNTAFEHLQNRRRQMVLAYFRRQTDSEIRLAELVDQLTAWENGTSPEEIQPDTRLAVYAALHQTHLPKLDADGFVEYDRQRKTVTLTDRGRKLQLYLTYSPESGIVWSRIFLVVSVIWVASLLVASELFFPFVQLSALSVAIGSAGTFLLLSMTYVWTTHFVNQRGPSDL